MIRLENGNREALTALRKRARTTKSSVPSPFESITREIGGPDSRPVVKEVCSTCGNHDSSECTWMMFPGTNVCTRIPFHAAHTMLESERTIRAKQGGNFLKASGVILTLLLFEVGKIDHKDLERRDFEAKKLQTYVKDKSLLISERGALSDRFSPGVLKSLVTLTDKRS